MFPAHQSEHKTFLVCNKVLSSSPNLVTATNPKCTNGIHREIREIDLLKSPVSVHAPGGLAEKGIPFQKGIQCSAVYPRAAAAHLKNVDLEPRDSTGKPLRLPREGIPWAKGPLA